MPKRGKGVVIGYTPRPDAEIAAETFAALCAFDDHWLEREELAAAGVAEHRVRALYGAEHAAILSGLIEHLRAQQNTARYRDSYMHLIQQKNRDFLDMRQSEAPDVKQRWLKEMHELGSTPEAEVFRSQLQDMQVCEARNAGFFTSAYFDLLLNSWWAMSNRHLIGAVQQQWLDELFNLASWDLFPRLRPDVDEAD